MFKSIPSGWRALLHVEYFGGQFSIQSSASLFPQARAVWVDKVEAAVVSCFTQLSTSIRASSHQFAGQVWAVSTNMEALSQWKVQGRRMCSNRHLELYIDSCSCGTLSVKTSCTLVEVPFRNVDLKLICPTFFLSVITTNNRICPAVLGKNQRQTARQ